MIGIRRYDVTYDVSPFARFGAVNAEDRLALFSGTSHHKNHKQGSIICINLLLWAQQHVVFEVFSESWFLQDLAHQEAGS